MLFDDLITKVILVIMNLGKRVKQRREELRLTQGELARAVGNISQESIALLEKRDSKSSRNITSLAEALSCSVEWLTTGNETAKADTAMLLAQANRLAKDLTVDELKELTEYKKFILSKRK